jgi:hypothetical protein
MAGFVCIYYGNTGSSWLMSALSESPQIHVPGFEPIETWAWDAPVAERLAWLAKMLSPPVERSGDEYRRWLAALRASPQVTKDPVDPGFTLTGIKMTDLPATDTAAVLDVLEETGSKVIHLTRANRLKHALSLYRYHDEDKSQFHGKDDYSPTKVEFRRFRDWLEESERLHQQGVRIGEQCAYVLGADRVFELAYEEFTDAAGKRQVLDRLATFLGIPAEFGSGEYAKATPDSLSEAISNYGVFRLRHRFTRYSGLLD